jgi:EAL domain-containing protein (putative c-di-GMP-specific phosphodiesterase class I)
VNILYYIFQNAIPPVFTIFIQSIGRRLPGKRTIRQYLLAIPCLTSFVLILTTGFTGLIFRFDGNLRYSRGPGLPILYAIVALYFVIIVASLILDRRRVSREMRTAILLFLPVCIAPIIIQFFIPELLLQNFGVSLSMIVILYTIQDYSALIDEESGLFNRDGFVAQFAQINRKNGSFTAILVSLDTVEFLRHGLGLSAFNSLQDDITRKLFGTRNESRFAAQIGSGRYIQVLVDPEEADWQCSHLLECFAKPWSSGQWQFYMSARICKIRIPEDTKDTDMILRANYHLARNRTRYQANTVLSLQDILLEDPGRHLDVLNAIRQALLNSGFELYFQPIVSVDNGKVVSAEALIRLHDENLGWISPDEFIPIAEQNGSIHRIGEWVIERSCEFLAELRANGLTIEDIEINLSAVQCIQSNLAERILALTKRYELEPADICLEVTETASNFSRSLMKKNLDNLVNAGFSVAIDDFGTGFANLSNLLAINFQRVKLDRSLVDGCESDSEKEIGIESMISMFRPLGTTIIAEGVETAAQLETVKALGVDLIQGYYFSKPLDSARFAQFVRERTTACI